ncbi:FimV/HubP family polar landmark protein [Ramlibacter rhizophilus]|uniref:Fimbrial protein FimV n=1 Tax=Ramlibacter rhizophilus TaxID=1781167 RepID=A0A4Z0BEF2_9BURK|nr:FimV/HubP family polar landmark protein [Ramlibacter rhizophilus]TFY96484.1 fimbrial protein FimV [Ramlibacter rhizophilus]
MRKPLLPASRAGHLLSGASRLPRWRSTAVALAAALLLVGVGGDAHALALGRVKVVSALGEPLQAEIEVPQISAEELESLKVSIASPAAFQRAGVELNQALAGARLALQRRADGSYFLRLSSERAINDPFLDVIVDAQWATGRIVRDFTMLLDPPSLRPSAPVAAQIVPPPVGRTSARAAAEPTPATPPAVRADVANRAPSSSAPAAAPAAARAAEPTPEAPARPAGTERLARRPAAPTADAPARVTVQPGDTAGEIATRYRPPSVSLDQMLVAMLRSNPEAFFGDNVNRLRSGAVLELPSEAQAAAVPRAEARQTIVAHSRDFNEFRRRLAQNLGEAPAVASASRSASGRVQTEVQDRGQATAGPDRLTLSKGSVRAARTAAEEERIARERNEQETAARLAELNKNIAELSRLSAATTATATAPAGGGTGGAAAAAPAAAPAAGIAVAAQVPGATIEAPAPAAAAAAEASAAQAPGAAAPDSAAPAAPAASAAAPTAAAAPPSPAPASSADEPALVDQLIAEPLVPAAAGGALALLLGWALLRLRRRNKTATVDSSFLESRLQPDSFFGASGGQRIDTAEAAQTTASSMVYSPSQLDAAGDVDPVAEADVYLAYGRDLQAEEILKEALRITPQRVAIHTKLLEIYARRRDAQAFELIASEAHALTQGQGPEWQHICKLGQELDAANPLYESAHGFADARRPGAATLAAAMPAASATLAGTRYITTDEADEAVVLEAVPPSVPSPAAPAGIDLDLDLDFIDSEGNTPASTLARLPADPLEELRPVVADEAAPSPADELLDDLAALSSARAAALPMPEATSLDFDLPPDEPAPSPAQPTATASLAEAVTLELPDLEFDPLPAPTAAAEAGTELSGLAAMPLADLSFEPAPAPEAQAAAAPVSDPLSFDLGDLSLQLDPPPSTLGDLPELRAEDEDFTDADPLATKLSLAEEFQAIGDSDGARSLAEEVLAEASGALQDRARRFLADLG